MALFKKRKDNKVGNADDINNTTMTAFDKIQFIAVEDSSDDTLLDISNKILDGYPVLVNFEKLGLQESNNMLSFLSGVVYATEGQTLRIQPRLFLLGRKEEFEDGTLYQYYEDLK